MGGYRTWESFNRTLLELKPVKEMQDTAASEALIEPYWN